MEGLGEKFQKARAARNLTLDEAARMTKIRPNKLVEIEAEDFSQFPSLAYAKGFVQIYGKFLNVDVSPYLEAFETSEVMTVDGYSYLQDNPVPPPRRTEVVRREPSGGGKGSLLPLVIGIVVAVFGFMLLKFMMDLRRLKPSSAERDAQALAQASSSATPGAANQSSTIVAPRALPVDSTPVNGTASRASAAPTAEPITASTPLPAATAVATVPTPLPTAQPTTAPAADGSEPEPEIRRAEPVHPEDLQRPTSAVGVNQFDIRPLKKTHIKVVVDGQPGVGLERSLDVNNPPVQLSGRRITLKVMDPTSVEIRKNGRIISGRDADVTMQ